MEALQVTTDQASTNPATRPASTEWLDTIRVEVNEVEALLASLAGVGVQVTIARNEAEQVKRARALAMTIARSTSMSSGAANQSKHGELESSAEQLLTCLTSAERGLGAAVERSERELAQCLERANRLRLLPVETLFPALARALREAALSLDKQVELKTSGGAIRLDADVLGVLQDALLHLVRNAVAHGIEDAASRTAAGKTRFGKVEIQVERRGARVSFICRDDGAGIDVAAIRSAATRKGALSSADAESLGLQEAIHLVLHGGLSTTVKVTGTSGRGIGLEIVRHSAELLKGEISIETTPGMGTSVEVCVPVSLSSVDALLVESAGVCACLPIECVRQSLRIREQDIACSGLRESVAYQDRAIPFLPLSVVLRESPMGANGRECKTAVVISSGGSMAALGVEKLLGTRSVLARSLPSIARADAVVSGASLDGEGNPRLVLNISRLIEVIGKGRSTARPVVQRNLPLLIIDDSLTTRMVERNILEAAGYQVETAACGEEALRTAHLHEHSLFLVDIEMPGMDGFEFISRAHNDPLLRNTPSILVSSRSSVEDKRHGEEVGARAHFVKSEFDQAEFLETVAHLVR